LPEVYRRLTVISVALLIAAMWLATRPYAGVIHDSRFYTVQTLNELSPGRFADDLYFRYGSQGEFTFFTQIYKPFLMVFGIANANLVLTLVAQFLWLTGLWYLTRVLFRDPKIIALALVAVILLPGGVGFEYGERFLTPRLFAEGLTFWALGSMLAGSPLRALLLLSISLTLHPIMSMPGLMILFIYQAVARPLLWIVAIVIGVATILAAYLGVEPFARLLVSFDPAWFSIVQVRNYFCLLTSWGLAEWIPFWLTFLLFIYELVLAHPDVRRFLLSVLAVGVGGLAVSAFGGDVLRNVLIVDVQQWRSTWILAVVGHLFVPLTLFRIKTRDQTVIINAQNLFCFAIAVLALSQFFAQAIVASMFAIVLAVSFGLWVHFTDRGASFLFRALAAVCFGIVVGILYFSLRLLLLDDAAKTSLWWEPLRALLLSVGAMTLVAVLLRDIEKLRAKYVALLLIASLVVLAAAIAVWDQRTTWRKFVDTAQIAPSSLTRLLPGASPIFWEGDVTVPWLLLRRPSYFSCDQGTGVLFSRPTAINYARRYKSFEPLRPIDFETDSFCPTPPPSGTIPNRATVARLCATEVGLSSIVLTKPISGVHGRIWISPVKYEALKKVGTSSARFETDKFYIYSCGDFREGTPKA